MCRILSACAPASLSRACRNSDGITSLEFALTFPIVMVFILGTMEFDRVMYLQLLLQAAVADASRYGFTGQASSDAASTVMCPAPYSGVAPLAGSQINTQYEVSCRIVEDLCPNSLAPTLAPLTQCPFDITQVNIQFTSFANLADVSTGSAASNGVSLAQQIQIYTLTYNLPFVTGSLNKVIGGKTFPINGYAIVYSEPFTT
jgi:Flp pilus assembly protein TadG